MPIRKGALLSATMVATLLAFAGSVWAGSTTINGITLNFPEYPLSGPALISCEPWEVSNANTITLNNVPAGYNVRVQFIWSAPQGGSFNYLPPITLTSMGQQMVVPVSYPADSANWPLYNPTTNERAIVVGVLLIVTRPDGSLFAKMTGKAWWIRCLPPPRPAEGCTPGYWRQDQHFDSWVPTGYAPEDDFEMVFGVDASFAPHSLLDAVWLGGGGENALARHAVAALLNASYALNYELTIAQIIAGVQSAYDSGDFETFKNQLDAANNAGCAPNLTSHSRPA